MSLRRYLVTSFVIITALFYALYFPAKASAVAALGPNAPMSPLLAMIPVLTGVFTMHTSAPLARKVPVEERNGFRSYTEANRPIWMMAIIVAVGYFLWGLGLVG